MSSSTVPMLFNPANIFGQVFYACIVLLLAWGAGALFNLLIHRSLDRAEAAGTDSTSIRFLGQLGRVIVYILAFAFYSYLIPPLHALGTAWLASVGVISVVIGLATQSTLSNLIAGISVILYRPFKIGDRIEVTTPKGAQIGVVELIDLGYTSLRTSDGRRVILPNSLAASQTTINFSSNAARVLVEVSINIADGNTTERAKEILIEVGKVTKRVTKVNGCFVTNISKNGATLMLSSMCFDPGDCATIKSDMLQEIQKRFAAENIQLA